jgi:hypothetical protein
MYLRVTWKGDVKYTLYSILETACSVNSFPLPGWALSPSMPIAHSPGSVWATLRKVTWNFKNNQHEGSKLEEAVTVQIDSKGF